VSVSLRKLARFFDIHASGDANGHFRESVPQLREVPLESIQDELVGSGNEVEVVSVAELPPAPFVCVAPGKLPEEPV
jgi:hypothetical protein